MIRPLPLVFALALSSPVLAQGGPPPPEVQVWVDLPYFEGSVPAEIQAAAEASAGLLGAIEERPYQSGWFTPAPWPTMAFVRDCYSGSAQEAAVCVRAAFQRSPEWTHPPVARAFVSIRPAPDGALDWACTGIGAEPTNAEAQRVRFTPADWDDEAAFWQARRAAAACVMAAAAESGW